MAGPRSHLAGCQVRGEEPKHIQSDQPHPRDSVITQLARPITTTAIALSTWSRTGEGPWITPPLLELREGGKEDLLSSRTSTGPDLTAALIWTHTVSSTLLSSQLSHAPHLTFFFFLSFSSNSLSCALLFAKTDKQIDR